MFPIIQTCLRPGMSKVNQENKADQDKKESTDRGDIRAISHIELIGDEEGEETKEEVE